MTEDVPLKSEPKVEVPKLYVECPKHGKHDAYILITVKGESTHHCAYCFRELLGDPLPLITE